MTFIRIPLLVLLLSSLALGQTVDGTHYRGFPAGTGAGETAELQSYELTVNGEEFFAWKAADSMAATTVYEMPSAFPTTANRLFTCTTGGVCTWDTDLFAETFTAIPVGTDPGDTGSFSGLELAANGVNFFRFKAADSMAVDTVYTMPLAFATADGQFFTCTTGGACLWSEIRVDASRNWIIGGIAVVAPTSANTTLVLGGSTKPSADPATGVSTVWSDGTLGVAYRTGVTGEGTGKTHSVHNRYVTAYGNGTSYTYTTTQALINYGTTPRSIVIPSAGTWRLEWRAYTNFSGATYPVVRSLRHDFRRTNNTPAFLVDPVSGLACRFDWDMPVVTTQTRSIENSTGSCIYVTANDDDIIQMWGKVNVLPSAGSVISVAVGSYLQAIRLF